MPRGPSPRARGSPCNYGVSAASVRSIPACAGLTVVHRVIHRRAAVHPRVRGAHGGAGVSGGVLRGPSPRARGSPATPTRAPAWPRSIPACAGLTRASARRRRAFSVHPRVRGAHQRMPIRRPRHAGPSPRARGSRVTASQGAQVARSIPACAGLTAGNSRSAAMATVHPRVRGAHLEKIIGTGDTTGPSPRARGSPIATPGHCPRCRSIPACAGLTERHHGHTGQAPVHPRVRGAHTGVFVENYNLDGPSPRARGSPTRARSRRSA